MQLIMQTLKVNSSKKRYKNFGISKKSEDNKKFSTEDELVEQIFSLTTKILDDGSYQVDMTLKTPKENLKIGNSLNMT